MQNAIAVAGNANIINAKYIPNHNNILLNPLYVSFSFNTFLSFSFTFQIFYNNLGSHMLNTKNITKIAIDINISAISFAFMPSINVFIVSIYSSILFKEFEQSNIVFLCSCPIYIIF